jgi:hypothetical protein
MKEKFHEYLKVIGMTQTLINRVETLYIFVSGKCPDEIEDIFVTDYINEEGARVYESLWFFSSKYCIEAHMFISQEYFDITPTRNRVVRWEMKKQEYDFTKATEKSRLYLAVRLDTGISCSFKVSKENCDYFKDIFSKYIQANLKE